MNKQIFLSIALIALVSFSPVRADETSASASAGAPAAAVAPEASASADAPAAAVASEASADAPKVEDKTAEASRWSKVAARLNAFCGANSTKIYVTAGTVAAAYVTHKVMYINCPEYKKWVDGNNEEEDANKLPWAKV